MEKQTETLIKKTIDFLSEIILLCKLLDEQKNTEISELLLKNATDIGINIYLAGEVYSDNRLLPVLEKATGKAIETLYWLKQAEKYNPKNVELEKYITDCEEILEMIGDFEHSVKHLCYIY